MTSVGLGTCHSVLRAPLLFGYRGKFLISISYKYITLMIIFSRLFHNVRQKAKICYFKKVET